ncbi:MAG: glycosyltransferase family 39 protein, partial [Actinobacteria bacterium]|nr:glycosyltransferase family 39 protein [Actinomycetota bacterium]
DRGFRIGVVSVGILALGVRLQNVLRNKVGAKLYGDAFDYFMQGKNLAEGHGFTQTLATFRINTNLPPGTRVPSAAHPPGFTVLLAFFDLIGLTTPLQQRIALCVVGTASVLLIVFTARRMLGRRSALVAGAIAALYPNLWLSDGLIMSETLFIFGFALGLLGIYRYLDDHRIGSVSIASVGFTIAFSTRPEQLLCFPLIVLPAVVGRKMLERRTRVGHLALASIFPLLVLVPWSLYNASRFTKPVLFTTGSGQTLIQGSCRSTFSGPLIGSYDYQCMLSHLLPTPRYGKIPDESVQDAHYRKLAFAFIKYHRWQLPAVVAAREGRLWAVFRPGQQNIADYFIERRGSLVLIQWTQRMYWVLAILALIGIWRFGREKIVRFPLLAEVGITAFVTALTFGNTRYRAGVEVCIVLFATAALRFIWRTWTARRGATQPDEDTSGSVVGSDSPETASTRSRSNATSSASTRIRSSERDNSQENWTATRNRTPTAIARNVAGG